MLIQTISIVKKVIEGRPTVQYYIKVYRGDDIWGNHKISYINYLHNQFYRHHRNNWRFTEKERIYDYED